MGFNGPLDLILGTEDEFGISPETEVIHEVTEEESILCILKSKLSQRESK